MNWPNCSDFWCEMTKLGELPSGVHQYHEVVSTDCGNKAAAWTIEAELDFTFTRIANEFASAEYQMRDEPKPEDDVLVDEGSLVVEQIDPAPRLRVTTTKRILFNHPFSGEALSIVMCATGYAYVVEDLVFSCAALGGGGGTVFPGKEPTVSKDKDAVCPDFGPMIKDLADQAAASVRACVDDCARAAEASSEKLAKGSYTADALVQDMTSMWVRMLRESATVVDLGLRSAGTATRSRARRPPAR